MNWIIAIGIPVTLGVITLVGIYLFIEPQKGRVTK